MGREGSWGRLISRLAFERVMVLLFAEESSLGNKLCELGFLCAE